MFYSVPVNNEQIITSTPIGARCITHVFFESKNDGVFDYKRNADAVTISIDGKMICRDVPVLPFLSSTTYGVNRYKWQDVALEVGINVNLSEIKISAQTINDFNVVFVYSNQESKKFDGFDFVECKKFTIQEVIELAERKEEVEEEFTLLKDDGETTIWDKTFTDPTSFELVYKITGSTTQLSKDEIFETDKDYKIKYGIFDADFTKKYENTTKQYFSFVETAVAGESGTTYDYKLYYSASTTRDSETMKTYLTLYQEKFYNNKRYSNCWGVENAIVLDREPQKMFFFQPISYTETMSKPNILQNNDVSVTFTLSGTDSEEFPPKTNIGFMTMNNNIAWRKCVHIFGQTMPRTIMMTLDYDKLTVGGEEKRLNYDNYAFYSKNEPPTTWDIYVIFIYKKLI